MIFTKIRVITKKGESEESKQKRLIAKTEKALAKRKDDLETIIYKKIKVPGWTNIVDSLEKQIFYLEEVLRNLKNQNKTRKRA